MKALKGFWENKFNELAEYNANKDKIKYTDGHIVKMAKLQSEYNEKMRKLLEDTK